MAYIYCRSKVKVNYQSHCTLRQVSFVLPSHGNEARQCGEVLLCDPCFLEAINIALLPAVDLKLYVLQIFQSQSSTVTTRARGL
jgi:hypothetical protein